MIQAENDKQRMVSTNVEVFARRKSAGIIALAHLSAQSPNRADLPTLAFQLNWHVWAGGWNYANFYLEYCG